MDSEIEIGLQKIIKQLSEQFGNELDLKGILFLIGVQELGKMSMQQSPNQVLAVCDFFEVEMPAVVSRHCFYLDDIRDPGNLGTIIRLADWFGPIMIPISVAATQNPATLVVSTPTRPAMIRPTSVITSVRFPPIQSSR